MALKGVTISLIEKTQSGTDAFGAPTYTEESISVDNVLVGSPSAQEVTDAMNLYGKEIVYILAIPKGDSHTWEDTTVVLPEPFAGTYRTVGPVQATIEDLTPLSWNKKVKVERYVGEN